MTRKRKHTLPFAEDDEALLSETRHAMQSLGWLLPDGEQAVALAEAALAGRAVPLPPGLMRPPDPSGESLTEVGLAVRPLRGPMADDIGANLARAAREGGAIGPEIEEQMRQDRLAAEREADDAQEPPESP